MGLTTKHSLPSAQLTFAGPVHGQVPKVRECSYADVKSPASLPLSLSVLLLGALSGAASHTNFTYHSQRRSEPYGEVCMHNPQITCGSSERATHKDPCMLALTYPRDAVPARERERQKKKKERKKGEKKRER